MKLNDYAVVFERVGMDTKGNYLLKVHSYVEGAEKINKDETKTFLVGPKSRMEFPESDINFMEDVNSLNSKYVYGSPVSSKVLSELLKFNLDLYGACIPGEEDIIPSNLEEFKKQYLKGMMEYNFYQNISNATGDITTYCSRKKPISFFVPMNNLVEGVVYEEMNMEIPDEVIFGSENTSSFKALPKSIDVKKIYEECKRYIIGQDEHIAPLLCAVNDNLNAKIPEERVNMLVCGSTGVGKTATFEMISKMAGVPMVTEDATQFTIAGYVGRDVGDIFEDLLVKAGNDLELAQRGIIFIDEIDKKVGGKDEKVSGLGVLQAFLKMLEGKDYTYETGKGLHSVLKTFNTLNTTIVFGGSFAGLEDMVKRNKKVINGFGGEKEEKKTRELYSLENLCEFGIPSEFVGRLTLLERFNELDTDLLKRILIEAKINPMTILKSKMSNYKTKVLYDEDFINAVAREAYNRKTGARGLYSVVEESTKLAKMEVQCTEGAKELILTPECIEDSRAYKLRRIRNRSAIK